MKKINRRKFIQSAAALPAGAFVYEKLDLVKSGEAAHGSICDAGLEISLKNISDNIVKIKKWVKDRPVMAVIKANAYGHGLVGVGSYLDKNGIDYLATGKLQEAAALREAGVKCPVLNFGPFSKEDAEIIVRENVSQSVYNDNVIFLNEAAKRLNKQADVHIKIDTGLGRVGIPYYTAFPFIEKVSNMENVRIAGVFTTFTEDEAFDREQLQRFLFLCERAKRKRIDIGLRHAASSAGVLSFTQGHLDMVRPGITIYGHYPSDEEYKKKRIDLKSAMSLKTTVSCVKLLRKGDSISYHQKYTAKREEKVVTAAIGYSDSFPVNVIGKASAIIKGTKFPLIAAVTSNHISILVDKNTDVKVGDEITLIGESGSSVIRAEELAEAADTSVYKILIWQNPLTPRTYIS